MVYSVCLPAALYPLALVLESYTQNNLLQISSYKYVKVRIQTFQKILQ